MFKAYRVEQTEDGVEAGWKSVSSETLPDHDVEIEVSYSSVNYKDTLSAQGHKGVTRALPHTPGIDAAGVVVSDHSGTFTPGQEVVLFGYDLGMNTPGGYGQRVRVPKEWVLTKPANMSFQQSMSWGTAGFTAALSVDRLIKLDVKPQNGPILVTGATGGVGSVAVALLAKLGYDVVACSGKADESDWLKALGASSVVARQDIMVFAEKPMAKPLYQAAVDTCGGNMISALLPIINSGGTVTTCGMVAGADFSASVFPFILRGVNLCGIDSVEIPLGVKQNLLNKTAAEWALPKLEEMTTELSREELPAVLSKVLQGQGVGRYRLDLNR